ncbi:MAG: ECF-type sigma factor [Planctomycetota bacterium]
MDEVTELLQAPDLDADERARLLLPRVYAQLRAAANLAMSGERPDHTLEPTALVHEAYLKLVGDREVPWQNRAHFYVAAAEAIRRILIDHARTKGRVKRGGGRSRAALDIGSVEDLASANSETTLAVDDAFRRLEAEHERTAAVARLKVFAGLATEDVARLLDVSTRTVEREWTFARRWMAKVLLEDEGGDGLGAGQSGS